MLPARAFVIVALVVALLVEGAAILIEATIEGG